MKHYLLHIVSLSLLVISGCDKKNDDLVMPRKAADLPQVIRFADEAGSELENSDEFSIVLTLQDRVDPDGEELSGTIIPLTETVRVNFSVTDSEAIDQLAAYIKGGKAFYEIDDCTNSEDQGIDLGFTFDPVTGNGSVLFPKEVEEIELLFELEEDYLNDAILNEEERSITFQLVSVESTTENVVVNEALEFTYEVLDDEDIYGAWELDAENTEQFTAFKNLFGLVYEDIASLSAAEVEKIEIEFELEEIKVLIELKETELVDDCGELEQVHKKIELELEIEELNKLVAQGELEALGELEQEDGSLLEYSLKGAYFIEDNLLQLELENELEEETISATLQLTR